MCCVNKMVHMAPSHTNEPPHQRRSYEEYVCGWGSAFINVLITFPLSKLMFRQMLHGIESQHAFQQLKKEGFLFLYRGCLPPLLQKTTSVSLMFGTYNTYRETVISKFPTLPQFSVTCLSSLLAGCSEATLTPFERVQTLLQDGHYNTRFRNTYHAFSALGEFGMREYYRGLTPILLRNFIGNMVFFNYRDRVQIFQNVNPLINDFLSGACIGAVTSTIFYPMNVVKTKMQITYGTNFISLLEAFWQTFNERHRSIRKMYMGVHLNYTRAFLSWGIINASHKYLKRTYFNDERAS